MPPTKAKLLPGIEPGLKYDAWGNRIEKRVDSNGDGTWDTTQWYSYDGWNPAKGMPLGNENFDVWADLDGSTALTTRYLRADLVDQLMARIDSGTAYWELGDRLGSIGHVIDNNGTVKDAITYDGWGNATHSNSAFAGRYLYTGREWETEAGLQYNRSRYYDPATGRWMSQDPLGFDAGDSNLYRYATNRFLNSLDPSGLDMQDDIRQGTKGLGIKKFIEKHLRIAKSQPRGRPGYWYYYLETAKELAQGFVEAGEQLLDDPLSIVTGPVEMVLHPIDTIDGMIEAAKQNPAKVAGAIGFAIVTKKLGPKLVPKGPKTPSPIKAKPPKTAVPPVPVNPTLPKTPGPSKPITPPNPKTPAAGSPITPPAGKGTGVPGNSANPPKGPPSSPPPGKPGPNPGGPSPPNGAKPPNGGKGGPTQPNNPPPTCFVEGTLVLVPDQGDGMFQALEEQADFSAQAYNNWLMASGVVLASALLGFQYWESRTHERRRRIAVTPSGERRNRLMT